MDSGGAVVSGLKSDEAAEGVDGWSVFVAVESAEHPGEVGGGGDRRAQPAADRLAGGGAAEVGVAAARAGRLPEDGQRPVLARERALGLGRVRTCSALASSRSARWRRARFGGCRDGVISSSCAISSVPWMTRAKLPTTT